jgi:hypothetical protein
MRALARDSQISTALSYYATDATVANTSGQIIWATPHDPDDLPEVAEIINDLFKKWDLNTYARDHILELATMGNLYIPTTDMYNEPGRASTQVNVALDNNTIPKPQFDIVPSYRIPPEDIVHLYLKGQATGYILEPEDGQQKYVLYPESAIIHFSLGGLLGEYTLDTVGKDNKDITYDILWADPLMARAIQPTQTLNLLEDAVVLSSLVRVVRFVAVDCGNTEEEEVIQAALQEVKDAIEQQLAINTDTGDAQSFVNPQSPNNLIYMPKVNGQDPVSITDLNMAATGEGEDKLLTYYQDKKLSVLGVPKEAMNFSSNEGLGGAGSVLSQRSALYANTLERLKLAYTSGWRKALNTYFVQHNMSGFVDKFDLHISPTITTMSTILFDRRDSALSQASALVDLLKSIGVKDTKPYLHALSEILADAFPTMSADVEDWEAKIEEGGEGAV